MKLFKTDDFPIKNDVARHFAQCFKTPSGRQVLAYLQQITTKRALPPSATEAELRALEASRALVLRIDRLIEESSL